MLRGGVRLTKICSFIELRESERDEVSSESSERERERERLTILLSASRVIGGS
jgi:hypothetical protein